MSDGIYVYGIIKTGDAQEFGTIGIGDQATAVLTVGFKDVAAVVSRSPLMVYDSLAREKTVRDLATHQFVIEKVMQRFTILPVKFGTMLETEDDVITFLKKGYILLGDELRKMAGKIELNVVASWDVQKVLAVLYRDNARLQKKQKDIAMQSDTVSLEDKIALGRLVEQTLQAQKTRYHRVILQTLEEETVDVCLHDLVSDEMIFNAAFLLEKKNEELFTETVTVLDHKLENAANFRMVGPLPVYSFSTILFDSIDPRRFEEAKKIFGLNGEITAKAVHDAYRQLAQKCHPDKGSAGNPLTFPVLNAAYRTLKNGIEHGLKHVEVYRWEKGA